MAKQDQMDRVVNLAKRRGLVFPSSEIYGGFRSTWDYGPLGVLLKRNVKDAWWRSMVQMRDDIVGLDCGRPRPTRMVTLGDSIAACFIYEFTTCAPTVVSEYLRERYAPDLQYLSVARGGAITAGRFLAYTYTRLRA